MKGTERVLKTLTVKEYESTQSCKRRWYSYTIYDPNRPGRRYAYFGSRERAEKEAKDMVRAGFMKVAIVSRVSALCAIVEEE